MKLAIANTSRQGIGGGWSFIANLQKGLGDRVQVTDWPSADLVIIPSASMIPKELFREMKAAGKKMVLRVDNALRNSRNRNTGMARMKEFAQGVDKIVYQSQWARGYLSGFLGRDGRVIYNGIDLATFKASGPYKDYSKLGKPVYLFSRFNRDESKQWHIAWYEYQLIHQKNPNAVLIIQGKFNFPENAKYNFDFFNGEKWEPEGIKDSPEQMAQVYRGCDYLLATYYNDCYSNTYQEAIACGCKLYKPSMTGGTPELIKNAPIDCKTMANKYFELFKEVIKK